MGADRQMQKAQTRALRAPERATPTVAVLTGFDADRRSHDHKLSASPPTIYPMETVQTPSYTVVDKNRPIVSS